ncbi:hypothetical protein RUM44_002255 [Polyplax serrata]|uniref:Uncharacterized protein n=1 Tax=Polyplax serrata TaxID=468196 RepID=A0ABR1AMQ2_POLSC
MIVVILVVKRICSFTDGNHSTAVGMYKSVKDVEEVDSVWNMNSSLLKPAFESKSFGKASSKRKRRQTNTEQTTETPTPVTSVILQVNPNITPGDLKSEMVTTAQAVTSVTEVTQTERTIKPGVTTADTLIEPTEIILGVSVTPLDVIVQPSKTSEQNSEVDTQPIQQTTETQTTDESSKEEDTEDTEDADLENLLSFLGDEMESRLDYLNQELEKANDLMSCLLDVLLKQLLSTVAIPHKQDAWNNCIKSTYGSAVSETDVLSKIFLNLWKETSSEPEKIS